MGWRFDSSCVPPASIGTMWSTVSAFHPHRTQAGLDASSSARFLGYSPVYRPVRVRVSLERGAVWLLQLLPVVVMPVHPWCLQALGAIVSPCVRFSGRRSVH